MYRYVGASFDVYACARKMVFIAECGGSALAAATSDGFDGVMRAVFRDGMGSFIVRVRNGRSSSFRVVVRPAGLSFPCKPNRPARPAICFVDDIERYCTWLS